MALMRCIFVLLLMESLSFCDCSDSEPPGEGRNSSTPVSNSLDNFSEKDYSSYSWSVSYDLNEITSYICPVDSDKCVIFTYYIVECNINQVMFGPTLMCFCTASCIFFDDCCHGYPNNPKEPYAVIIERQYWGCTRFAIGLAHNTSCNYTYFVVNRCPNSGATDPQLKHRCENPRANDTVFVDSQTLFYRNRYCALCHGINPSELTPYIIFYPCQDNLPNEDTFCGQIPYKLNGVAWRKPRLCIEDSDIISRCDSKIRNQSLHSLCLSESERRVWVAKVNGINFADGNIYRNVYCAMCNGLNGEKVINITKTCDTHKTVDKLYKISYYYPELQCSNGLQLSGTECVPEVSSWPDCETSDFIFAVVSNGSSQCYKGFDGFKTMSNDRNLDKPEISNYDFVYDLHGAMSFTTFLKFPADFLPHRSKVKELVGNSFEEIHDMSCPDNTIIIRERCNIVSEQWMDNSGNLSDITDDPRLFEPVEINSTLYIVYDETTFIRPVLWENYTYFTRFSDEWNFTKQLSFSLYGHFVDIQTCASIVVGDAFITENEIDDVTVLIYQGIEFHPDKYTRYKNGSVRLCWTSSDPPEPVSMFNFSRGQYLLNVILLVVSTICLLVALITYCIFKPLRNLQGISIMNFITALFIAQVMLQYISPNMPSFPILCTIAAVVTHYSLLAAFTWTNILAWDLVRHFASSSFLPKRHKETRRLIVYHTIGWCLPFIIIVPCLIVQSQNPSLFRYGKIGSSCWIYQAMGIVLTFLVPIAISFLVNFVLFLLTTYGVHKSKCDSSMLHEGAKERRQELFQELLVHFKISCLLGFGWSFGFIASFTDSAAVWTIFILTSSLQGIFVFIFFGANQRVRDLWRNKVCGSAAQTRSSTTLTSSTNVGSKTKSNESKIKTTTSCSTTGV
ncbi:uncharacterized protein LOC129254001 isoform X1 [Lytechinus pictus]|uniref:uncharacterized protein LOC129254001 isoform X1 n=2 Tax=Lytechinus pictus TaxID=7653 RepID=UPI0030BA245E